MVGAQTMMIEELRESLSRQVDLIEELESQCSNDKHEHAKLKRKIDDRQDAYDGLLAEYQELQNAYAVQREERKHVEASRDFYIDCHSAQVGTIARLYKELDEANARADANREDYEDEASSRDRLFNELADLKVAYANSGVQDRTHEIEALSAQLEALRTRYKALQMVKDDYLEANTALHQIINNVRRATDI
jgi:chromosome segregation ATPase